MKKIRMFKNIVNIITLGIFNLFLFLGILVTISLVDNQSFSSQLFILSIFYSITAFMVLIWVFMLFHFVVIDSTGVKITYFYKVLRTIKWDEISGIEFEFQSRKPMYKIILLDGKSFSFIRRKKFKLAIMIFGTEKHKQLIKNL